MRGSRWACRDIQNKRQRGFMSNINVNRYSPLLIKLAGLLTGVYVWFEDNPTDIRGRPLESNLCRELYVEYSQSDLSEFWRMVRRLHLEE